MTTKKTATSKKRDNLDDYLRAEIRARVKVARLRDEHRQAGERLSLALSEERSANLDTLEYLKTRSEKLEPE